jgi:3',5'-cyclic AMP phosphodiesterase CpdA
MLTVRQRWLAVGMVLLVAGGLLTFALMPSDGSPTASEETHQPSTAPFRFVVVGDYGEGGTTEAKIASAIDRWTDRNPIDAFVSTGDNVYQSGAPEQFMGAWTVPYGWVSHENTPVIATLGNHDIETDGGHPVMDLLGMSARWYTRRIGPVEFIILDANDPTNADQLRFLNEALAESTSRWKIAVFHQPVYSCSRHGSTPTVDAAWLPLLEKNGVDLVLNGHDHTYQRFGPIEGTTYIVTGGGGAELYYETACPASTPAPDVHETVHNFVTLWVSGSTLRLETLSADGQLIDRVNLSESSSAP